MKTTLLCTLAVVATAAITQAQDLFVYDNTVNGLNQFYLNGGATLQTPNTITRLVADDITPAAGFAGQSITRFYFGVYNNNSTAVSARPRIRFYGSDGAGGGPGTYITGYTFNPISFAANNGSTYYATVAAGTFPVPSGTFWMGMTFDNNNGGTGATATQLDNLGLLMFNPPTVGTSADTFFTTTGAGSFLVSNPAGTLQNFSGNPVANFFFGITVIPEPATASLLLLGVAGLFISRRKA